MSVERPIGYVASAMGERSPAAIVELLAGAGYEAVDWTMEQFDPLHDQPERLRELVEQARGAGLVVAQLMVHQDHVTLDEQLWEQRVRRAERAVQACAQAQIPSIGALTGPNPWEPGAVRVGVEVSEARAWELALRALERVLRCAEAEGVRMALEPCWGTLAHGRYRAEYVLAALDCAALAINFDPSHHVLCGDDIPGAVRAWSGRIAHVHLKDALGVSGPGARPRACAVRPGEVGVEGEDFAFLLPGEGAVPWPELLDALDEVGYAGAMSVENEAYRLLEGPLRGDVARSAALARELAAGLAGGRRGVDASSAADGPR
ncbi:MAG TPA: sugar phosphate isomerase/epimerase family protein [Solirubrobacteraceae bacterium]|jgi:sugar phosphate isomerase/epimerase|nr:sugar phosphate isomerase/epimerase family protein [Solirubrobacteraceae bacterium]